MTIHDFLTSPTIIATAALFIGLAANVIAIFLSRKADRQHAEAMRLATERHRETTRMAIERHRENLHIAIVKLRDREAFAFDELQSMDK